MDMTSILLSVKPKLSKNILTVVGRREVYVSPQRSKYKQQILRIKKISRNTSYIFITHFTTDDNNKIYFWIKKNQHSVSFIELYSATKGNFLDFLNDCVNDMPQEILDILVFNINDL